MREQFRVKGATDLLTAVANINDFRNKYVAYQQEELRDVNLARAQLSNWVAGLYYMHPRRAKNSLSLPAQEVMRLSGLVLPRVPRQSPVRRRRWRFWAKNSDR
jgi:hypothetical protein